MLEILPWGFLLFIMGVYGKKHRSLVLGYYITKRYLLARQASPVTPWVCSNSPIKFSYGNRQVLFIPIGFWRKEKEHW
jgi:hypothetical protein